jgi:hypothetical protein
MIPVPANYKTDHVYACLYRGRVLSADSTPAKALQNGLFVGQLEKLWLDESDVRVVRAKLSDLRRSCTGLGEASY